jgi:hypothetical protein
MRNAAIEGAADDGASGFEDIGSAEVLPQAERNRRKDEAGAATAAKDGVVIASWIGNVGHASTP